MITPLTENKKSRFRGLCVIPFGFEPKTYCLEGSCSIQLSYETISEKKSINFKDADLKTSDLQIDQSSKLIHFIRSGWQDSNLRPSAPKADAMTGLRYTPNTFKFEMRRKRDSNPRYRFQYDSLANCWFQPLTHLSVFPKRFANIEDSFFSDKP